MALMRDSSLARRPGTRRSGFTLVELLVAVVLVDVGLLAIVGAGAVVVRRTSELRARSAAVRIASNRLELLGGIDPCSTATGGGDLSSGMAEVWSVEVQGSAVRDITDSVSYQSPTGSAGVVLRTRVPC